MPRKTSRRSRGMPDRLRDELAVIGQRANQGMLFQKRQHLLSDRLTSHQLSDRPQSKRAIRQRDLAGGLQFTGRMPPRQTPQSLQHADPFDAAVSDHRFGPRFGVRTDLSDLFQEPGGAPFDAGDFLARQVPIVRAESASFMPRMDGN